jgi:hypothetical protein
MWYMRPISVAIDVPNSREEVFDFLDVMANHELFTNHLLTDWECSGPGRGVGSKARVHAKAAGQTDVIDIEVVTAEPPTRIVEQNVGAKGRRRATGTYTLRELPGGATRIEFEYSWQRATLSERLAAPIIGSILRKGNRLAMQRLAEQLSPGRG